MFSFKGLVSDWSVGFVLGLFAVSDFYWWVYGVRGGGGLCENARKQPERYSVVLINVWAIMDNFTS